MGGAVSYICLCDTVSWTLSPAKNKRVQLKAGPPWHQGLCLGCLFSLECLMT